MDERREQHVTFTKSEGSGPELSQTFDFFWERLILSPRLKAIPCERKGKGFIITDFIETDKSIKILHVTG